MSPRTSANAVGRALVVLACLLGTGPWAIAQDPAKDLLGSWKCDANPGADQPAFKFFEFRADKLGMVVEFQGQSQLAFARATYEPGKINARIMGKKVVFAFELRGQDLTLTMVSEPKIIPGPLVFKKLAQTPPELQIQALVLGKPESLSRLYSDAPSVGDALDRIRKELAKRLQADQAVRTDPQKMAEMAKVDLDNTAYLMKLIKEVGWIDVQHFGAEASNSAFLLVQHSGNLSLMSTALPLIKEDVLARKLDPQAYALLYDRLMLFTGEKQRYGTQLSKNEKGEMVVSALENKEKVEEFRKEIGLFPLSRYLENFKKGAKVVFEDE